MSFIQVRTAMTKSPKVSSLYIFLTKQMLVKISNKSHFHIHLLFISVLFIAEQSRSLTENMEEVFASDIMRRKRECSSHLSFPARFTP